MSSEGSGKPFSLLKRIISSYASWLNRAAQARGSRIQTRRGENDVRLELIIVIATTTDERLNDLAEKASGVLFQLALLVQNELIGLLGGLQSAEICGAVRREKSSIGSILKIGNCLGTILQNLAVGSVCYQSVDQL